MPIKYSVYLANPHAHTFKVKLEIQQPDPDGQILSLPAWIPGSYMIRDFAKNINNLHAYSDEGKLVAEKIDKSTWKIEPSRKTILVEYEVYAWDHSVRSAHFDMTHAFFNGTSMFLAVSGQEDQAILLDIIQPKDKSYKHWKVTTALQQQTVNSQGFGTYSAPDYDDLVDHPVEIGTHTEFCFEVKNIKHHMAFTGICDYDSNRLSTDISKICNTHCEMFGEIPDISQYIFMTMVTGNGYGGLEHRSSTSLMCSRNDLPGNNHPAEPDDNYRNFLGLCSHEYFHTWNVKRIKPAVFLPYNLSSETYTRQLWAFEGITSYYDELGLIRSGVISVKSYLELLAQTITRVNRNKGRLIQSVAESSFDAWTKFYKQDENAPNSIVSYYAKGALIALSLDLTMRDLTNGKKSLDDLMRRLWQDYGKVSIGVPEGKIEEIASEISSSDLSDFFNRYLYGTEDLPLHSLLETVGVDYKLYATTDVDDKGGKPPLIVSSPVSFGARLSDDTTGIKLVQVFKDESAEQAGLSANDIIIAVNNLKVDKSGLNKLLSASKPGDEMIIHAFRRDELYQFNLKLKEAEHSSCYLELSENIGKDILGQRESWLNLSA